MKAKYEILAMAVILVLTVSACTGFGPVVEGSLEQPFTIAPD